MNILYVYAHPSPTSFNGMLYKTGCEYLAQLKHPLKCSDLYAEHFNAIASWHDFNLSKKDMNPHYFLSQQVAFSKHQLVADIDAEIKKIAWANHLIFQFPLWWFSVPAIMKGWLDRVLVKGFAYDTGQLFEDGLLKGKTASLVVSTQSPESAYQVEGVHGATIDAFLHPIHHTLRFIGITPLPPFVTYGAFNMEAERCASIVMQYHTYLKNLG